MAERLSHYIYATVLLVFLLGAISFVFTAFDAVEEVDSGIIRTGYASLDSSTENVTEMVSQYTDKVDSNTSYVLDEGDLIDTRGDDSWSILNFFSKNILTKFITSLHTDASKAGIYSGIFWFISAILGLSISVMLIRATLNRKY